MQAIKQLLLVNGRYEPFVEDDTGRLVQVAWAPMPGSQEAYLKCTDLEALLEGPRGTGKTERALAGFIFNYVGKGWGTAIKGVLIRRNMPMLSEVVRLATDLVCKVCPDAKYNEMKSTFTFKNGETLRLTHYDAMEDSTNFLGHSYCWICFEELSTWPNADCYQFMFSTLRSTVPGLPLQIRATTNPWGVGKNWIKQRFRLPPAPGLVVGPAITDSRLPTGEIEPPRRAIHSRMSENIFFAATVPNYKQSVAAATGQNSQMYLAHVLGDWNAVAGGMFDDIWPTCRPFAVIDPFDVPEHWPIYRAYDHGGSRPFSVGYYARSDGTDLVLRNGKKKPTLRGDIFRVGELYGWNGRANEGLRLLPGEIAERMKQYETHMGWRNGDKSRIKRGPADTGIFDDSNGVSIAAEFEKHGIYFEAADKGPGSRIQGWAIMRICMMGAVPTEFGREEPGLFVCSNCLQWISDRPDKGRIYGQSYRRTEKSRTSAETDAAKMQKQGYGLYFNCNDVKPLGKSHAKASEDEVLACYFLHADSEVNKSITDPAEFEKAKAELLECITTDSQRPTYIINSGNGFGLFWQLEEPTKDIAAVKARNIALRDKWNGDNCQDTCHVMRLPFTVNYSNKRKIARGRPPMTQSTLVEDNSDDPFCRYKLTDFETSQDTTADAPETDEIEVPDSVDLSRIDADLLKWIKEGATGPDRSREVYNVACDLRRCGYSDGEIIFVITNPDYGISAHIHDAIEANGRTVEAQAKRIIDDMDKEDVPRFNVNTDFADDPIEPDAADSREEERICAQNEELPRIHVSYKDFLLYLPDLKFISIPNGSDTMWEAEGVDMQCKGAKGPPLQNKKKIGKTPEERIKIDGHDDDLLRDENGNVVLSLVPGSALVSRDRNRRVSGITWWPGKPSVIIDTVVKRGGIERKPGMNTFNRYLPPHLLIVPSNKKPPTLWLNHIKLLYSDDDARHIVEYLAWRVQHPEIKILHALVLGGPTRIGKDTIIRGVVPAIGAANFQMVDAQRIMDEPKFNPYLESVLCLISEGKDFGERDRYAFYERTKPWLGGTATGVLMVGRRQERQAASGN